MLCPKRSARDISAAIRTQIQAHTWDVDHAFLRVEQTGFDDTNGDAGIFCEARCQCKAGRPSAWDRDVVMSILCPKGRRSV